MKLIIVCALLLAFLLPFNTNNSMDATTFFLYAAAVAVGLYVQYLIIRAATGTANREHQLKLQNQILLHIAKQQGVNQERLDSMEKDNMRV